MKKSLNYQDSCFIVNAMEFYLSNFKNKTALSEESLKYFREIINTYEKLENQILLLTIKEN